MQYHINHNISPTLSKEYLLACSIKPEKYGPTNLDYYLMWLQAFDFSSTETAEHICNNFHYKAKLFGIDKIAKTITLDDIKEDPDTFNELRTGRTMWLPTPDTAGRPVLVNTLPSGEPPSQLIHFVSTMVV